MTTFEVLSLIITGLGVIATFSAVVVALWQTKYANKKKLKCKFIKDNTVVNPSTGDKKLYIGMDISNIGNKRVIVTGWKIKLKDNHFLLIMTSGFENDLFDKMVSIKTPVTMEPEDNITFFYSRELFKDLIAEYIAKGEIDSNKKIDFVVNDSTGKTYKCKSLEIAKKYL